MKYCLNKVETAEFCSRIKSSTPSNVEEFEALYAMYESWETEISVLNYLHAQILQRKINKGIIDINDIELLYEKQASTNLEIQEFSSDFVHFLISHTSSHANTLEEDLVLMSNKHSEYDWRTQIRD